MTRRTFFSTLALLAMVMTMIVAGPADTSAQQNPNCCTYTVDFQDVVLPPCNYFWIYTQWDCNGTSYTLLQRYDGPGMVVEPIGPPLLPCPPACELVAISLDGLTFIGPGQSMPYMVGDCCYTAAFSYDGNGCIFIKIINC